MLMDVSPGIALKKRCPGGFLTSSESSQTRVVLRRRVLRALVPADEDQA